jgi:hypothetical protein
MEELGLHRMWKQRRALPLVWSQRFLSQVSGNQDQTAVTFSTSHEKRLTWGRWRPSYTRIPLHHVHSTNTTQRLFVNLARIFPTVLL